MMDIPQTAGFCPVLSMNPEGIRKGTIYCAMACPAILPPGCEGLCWFSVKNDMLVLGGDRGICDCWESCPCANGDPEIVAAAEEWFTAKAAEDERWEAREARFKLAAKAHREALRHRPGDQA